MQTNKNSNIKILTISLIFFIYAINLLNCFDVRKGMSGYNRFRNLSKNYYHNETKIEIKKTNNLKKILNSNQNLPKNTEILDKFSDILKTLKNEEADYKEYFHDVKVDHFSYNEKRTFPLRYLVKDKYFDKTNPDSPILFYCGNEGPVEAFWKNSGFVTEFLAQKYKALVIFGEHRYFGKSMPFGGKQDKDAKKNQYSS